METNPASCNPGLTHKFLFILDYLLNNNEQNILRLRHVSNGVTANWLLYYTFLLKIDIVFQVTLFIISDNDLHKTNQ